MSILPKACNAVATIFSPFSTCVNNLHLYCSLLHPAHAELHLVISTLVKSAVHRTKLIRHVKDMVYNKGRQVRDGEEPDAGHCTALKLD